MAAVDARGASRATGAVPRLSPSHAPLRVPLRCRRCRSRCDLRRLCGAADHGTAHAQGRRSVQPIQAAKLHRTVAPSVEDPPGGATGVPEITAARRSPGGPLADRADGLSVAGTALPPEGRAGGSAGRAAQDQRILTAALSQLWLAGMSNAG